MFKKFIYSYFNDHLYSDGRLFLDVTQLDKRWHYRATTPLYAMKAEIGFTKRHMDMTSEKQIEDAFIKKLQDLKYTYRPDIRDKAALEANFRAHFQRLNRANLNDAEFARLRDDIITADVFAAAQTLRETQTFQRDDGTPLHYTLVNITDWCKNEFEVINQLRINTDNSFHRYDVIILMNGVPVAQIELKSLEVTPKKAMEQIVDYKNDPGNGFTNSLLCFMQLFIVSNQTTTWYFANNQPEHFSFNADERFLPIYQLADPDNRKITHLHEFAEKFLAKCALGQMISRYMVLVACQRQILIMRPYQIYAVKAIVDCIHQNRGNGYIWHTTGSGKTLTSFKAATLLKDNPDIEKCLFVVDRKDLDKQTRDEFNKFQDGCVEENTNTAALARRLLSDHHRDKVIVCTIQKLGLALDEHSARNQRRKEHGRPTYAERLAPLRDKRLVIIFDECHRSQFGDTHQTIKKFFPRAQLFGFTGTPIFEENSTYTQIDGEQKTLKTTQDIFEKELHAYTITHAIEDKNVLRFHVDYYTPDSANAAAASGISRRAVVDAILEKHDAATHSRRFNAILATASINDAIEYYNLFKTAQAERKNPSPPLPEGEGVSPLLRGGAGGGVIEPISPLLRGGAGGGVPLNIACVFSPPANGDKDARQIQEDLPQEQADNQQEPERKQAALAAIIADYNAQYGTNHRVSEFDLYYQDVQKRIKDQQWPNADYPHKHKIDLVIVVDMLLTGFDSKYLNTMYVDKNLKHHRLIQAFSRTNRVLNNTKPAGHILDFRQQSKEVDEAIMLFSGQDIETAKKIWIVDPAPVVVEKLEKAITRLEEFMTAQGLPCLPQEAHNLKGVQAKIEFLNTFKEVQRLTTQLDQYTDLSAADRATLDARLPEDTRRSFRGVYLDIAEELKPKQGNGRTDAPAELEQLDFEFVLFSSVIIDYDYIMALLSKYTYSKPEKQKMTRAQLITLLCSTANLMRERDEMIAYLDTLKIGKGLSEQEIREGYQTFKAEQAARELTAIARKHGLNPEALQSFADEILDRLIFDGEKLSDLMAPLELGWKVRTHKEVELMTDLIPLLKKRAGREIAGLKAYE